MRGELSLSIYLKFTNIKRKVDGWDILKDEKEIFFLTKKFSFKNFIDSQKFIKQGWRNLRE